MPFRHTTGRLSSLPNESKSPPDGDLIEWLAQLRNGGIQNIALQCSNDFAYGPHALVEVGIAGERRARLPRHLEIRAARTASHSRSATTPTKSPRRITLAEMLAIEDLSIASTLAPAP